MPPLLLLKSHPAQRVKPKVPALNPSQGPAQQLPLQPHFERGQCRLHSRPRNALLARKHRLLLQECMHNPKWWFQTNPQTGRKRRDHPPHCHWLVVQTKRWPVPSKMRGKRTSCGHIRPRSVRGYTVCENRMAKRPAESTMKTTGAMVVQRLRGGISHGQLHAAKKAIAPGNADKTWEWV